MVGERGFEPPTPWSRTRCSTRLSHSPTVWSLSYYAVTSRSSCNNSPVAFQSCTEPKPQSIALNASCDITKISVCAIAGWSHKAVILVIPTVSAVTAQVH